MTTTTFAKKKTLKRPHYATTNVLRPSYLEAKKAAAEVNEDMVEFSSKALDARSKPILARRDKRILKEAAIHGGNSSHNVTT